MNNMNMRKYQEQYEVAFTGFFYKMKSFDSSKSTVKLVEAFKQKKELSHSMQTNTHHT